MPASRPISRGATAVAAVALLGCLLVVVPGCSKSGTANTTVASSTAYVQKNVDIPMRDGTVLRANVIRPAKTGKYPVLIFRTPYSKDEGDEENEKSFAAAVKRGYAMVVQDVRGRYSSEGTFTPYANEGKDGYDTIEWAAKQSWSDGNVGTFGLSYPGAVQWLAAVENPPHLKAAVPAMCFSRLGSHAIYFGGVFESAWASWCYKAMSPDSRMRKGTPGPKTYEAAAAEWDRLGGADHIQGWLPSMLMPYLRNTEPYYYTQWLTHGPYDPWWSWGDLTSRYGNAKAAILNLSGWYDEPYGTEGAITNYTGLLRSRAGQGDPRTKLLIGPWIHGVDAVQKAEAGGRTFAANAVVDYDQVVLDWLDHFVRGIDNGVEKWPGAKVYSMGDDTWLSGAKWPVTATTPRPMYLTPGASANATGSLAASIPSAAGKTTFVSNPAEPLNDKDMTNFGAYDLRRLSGDPGVATFETAPLDKDLSVMGHVIGEMYVSADVAPDYDLYVKLIDVGPDGTAFNLESAGHEVVRVSYRDKTVGRKLVKSGQVVKLAFDNMITGNTFKKGHRLRVYLMGSWFPVYSRNLQTGLPETYSSKMRTAKITVHTGPQYPSSLRLPVRAGK